jgi:hypothetical protein
LSRYLREVDEGRRSARNVYSESVRVNPKDNKYHYTDYIRDLERVEEKASEKMYEALRDDPVLGDTDDWDDDY